MTIVAMLTETDPTPAQPACANECRWGECRYKTPRVRAYIVAYREALKHGDEPAEYIRDSVKSSRPTCPPCHKPDPTDPAIRGTTPRDRTWHIDVKIGLERARDVGGLRLESWNAERVAHWLCPRALEDVR